MTDVRILNREAVRDVLLRIADDYVAGNVLAASIQIGDLRDAIARVTVEYRQSPVDRPEVVPEE